MTPFDSPDDVARWLDRFENTERLPVYRPFTLDTMRLLSGLAGNPELSAPVIHIAGSKGKGSVTAMTTAILEAAGLKTARYTSPMVKDYWDRICQGNAPFHERVYVEAGRELARIEERRLREHPGGETPSMFEMFTLLYFLCARIARADVMVVETGLGGTHDATNVVNPVLSVLTLIEKEHTEVLGDSLRSIAAHKAGIIKTGRPVLSAEQEGEVLALFRETAAAKDAKFWHLPDRVRAGDIALSKEGTSLTLRFPGGSGAAPLFPEDLEIALRIPGAAQARNAALAAAASKLAFPRTGPDALRRGLASLTLPARFERLRAEPELIADGAHTPKSIEECVRTFTCLYGEGGVLVFGCAASKDAAALARLLVPHFSRIYITRPGTFKASRPEEVHRAFLAAGAGPEILLRPDTALALREALKAARGARLPVLGTGSFYLAAELGTIVRDLP